MRLNITGNPDLGPDPGFLHLHSGALSETRYPGICLDDSLFTAAI